MIRKIRFNSETGVFISFYTEKGEGKIPYSGIIPYWDHAKEDEFEGGFAKAIDDVRILAVMLVASGQGGVALVWNTKTESVEHISQADFCEAATIWDDYVYTLCITSGSFAPTVAMIEKIKLGTKNVSIKPEQIKEISASKFDDYTGNLGDIEIVVDNDGIKAYLKRKEVEI